MSINPHDFNNLFIETASNNIAIIKRTLVTLRENSSNKESIELIFRAFHSLKSECGAMGYQTMSSLCLKNQQLLEGVHKGELILTSAALDELQTDIASLEDSLEHIKQEVHNKSSTK